MHICTQCILPDTFPGINFDDHGVCNFCRNFKGEKAYKEEKESYYQKFTDIIAQAKGKRSYDAILAYSGGKDSTYTLYLLKEIFHLRVLVVTFDNGFISDQAFKNIRTVTENLGVDGIVLKADFGLLKTVFKAGIDKDMYPPKALERASTICTTCIGLVKFTTLKIAVEKSIPFMAWGWSPGQAPIRSSIMKINSLLYKETQEMYRRPMHNIVGDKIDKYFLAPEQYQNIDFLYNVSPLAFMEYDENKILTRIEQLGWAVPSGLDANSTNCLLNGFANHVHIQKHGFHPYAFEIAGMVRANVLSRAEGMKKIYYETDAGLNIDFIRAKLGL